MLATHYANSAESRAIVTGLVMQETRPTTSVKRKVNQEEYAAGYRCGLSGKKCRSIHPDYTRGHANGLSDLGYNKRTADAAKVFAGWSVLPGQSEMF